MTLGDQLQRTLGAAYTIERELGGGGMSRVFVATETALKRRVVVKVLPGEMSGRDGSARKERVGGTDLVCLHVRRDRRASVSEWAAPVSVAACQDCWRRATTRQGCRRHSRIAAPQ